MQWNPFVVVLKGTWVKPQFGMFQILRKMDDLNRATNQLVLYLYLLLLSHSI